MAAERALLAILAVAGAFCLYLAGGASPAFLSSPGELGEWRPTISLTSNAYFLWRVDPFVAALSSSPSAALALQLFVFVTGTAVLLQAWRHEDGWGRALPAAICSALVLLYLFGVDSPLFGALAWMPLFVYLQARIVETPSSRSMLLWVLLLFVSVRVTKGANFLAPLILFGSVAITSSILPASDDDRASTRSRILAIQLVFALVPYLLFLLDLPRPGWFDYPDSARLVPDDGTPGILRPHTGWAPPIPLIDRPAVRALYLWPSVSAFAGSLALLLYSGSLRIPFLALVLSACVLFDSGLPEPLTEIAPVSVISRMLPGAFLVPLSTLFLSVAFFCLLLAAYGSGRRATFPLALVLLVALPGANGSYMRWGRLVTDVDPALLERTDRAIFSPSLYLIRTRGLAVLDERQRFEVPGFGAIRHDGAELAVSDHSEWIPNMRDRAPETRWSASNGGQHGREWLHVRFPEITRVSGLHLDTGSFATDYPQTLRVSFSRDCPVGEQLSAADLSSYEVSLNRFSWQGPVRYTPDGLPYLGEKSDVRLVLPAVVEARCMAVEQIGLGRFDWSVAELRFADANAAGLADAP